MKTLQFDAGNTRLKWQLWKQFPEYRRTLSSGFINNDEDWEQALPALLDSVGKLDLVSVSAVSGDGRFERIRGFVASSQNVPIYRAETKKVFAGVTIAYKEPERLGVDRWLAMLAAHDMDLSETKIVVDCGTAITVDVLNASGEHIGGYLVPGVSLMKLTLASNMARLKYRDEVDLSTSLGKTTAHCIDHGVLSMAAALIEKVASEYPDSIIVLAGGDAPKLEKLISIYKEGRVVLEPDLVMDGLVIAAREERRACAG